MPFDLSLPLFAAFGLALGAVMTYFGWPHIHIRTYNKTLGNLRIVEVAFILSRGCSPKRARNAPKPADERRGAEFVIYMTLKAGNL